MERLRFRDREKTFAECEAVVFEVGVTPVNFAYWSVPTMADSFPFFFFAALGQEYLLQTFQESDCGKQLQVWLKFGLFGITRACCKVAHRAIEVNRHARPEELFLHCIVHASLTWVCSSFWIILRIEHVLFKRYHNAIQ